MDKHNILGIKISSYKLDEIIKKIINSSLKNISLSVAPIASHSVIESQFDNNLKNILNKFDLVLPDGQSLIWAERFLYKTSVHKRVYGPDLLLKLCARCEKEKIKVIFYGNHTDLVSQKLKEKYPKLVITALPDLNYKKISNTDVDFLLKTLSKYKKSIIFIGIGSPAQHFLLAKLKKIKTPVIAVGAAFDFLGGTKKQAPIWMRKLGLEWLFRLIQEPKRLWKRYLLIAPAFVLLVLIHKFSLWKKSLNTV